MAEGEHQESSRIFISYRREDSAGFVRALLGPLRQRFGSDRIFKDTDNIPPGEDFVNAIRRELESCKVLLAVIGGEWMTVEDPRTKKRRLDNPNDYLRLEVATALKNEHVVVIPVLVDRAGMPSPEDLPEDLGLLARRNAIELSDSRWDTDIERLVRAIEAICNDPALEEKEQVEPAPREPGKSAKVPSGDTGGFERLELRRKRQIAEHMAVARQAFEIQDFEAVLASCESAVWLDPQEPEARDLAARARTALDERQIQEWLAEAGRALEKGELAAASEGIDQALARSPDHPGALKLRQDLLRARQDRERQRQVDRLVAVAMKSARSCVEEEDFSAALSHVEDALALAPESREAHELKAQIVAARDELQRVRELKRRAQQAVTAAQAEFAAGKHDAALSRLEQFAPPHDLVARALADLRQQAEEAKETARREKAARDAEAAAEEARETARREKAARDAEAAAEEARETARREKAARDAEAAAEEAKEAARREKAARDAEAAAKEAKETARREKAARDAEAAAEVAKRERQEQAAREEAARLAAAAKARQEQIEQATREEEARRLELAVVEKLETASKVDDHEVALSLLNEALTFAPADPRIHAQIARRDAALQNQRAEEHRRQAEVARRLEEAREREEAARKREEALSKILTRVRNEPVDEVAIGLLNDGLRIAPGDPRFQTLVGERTAALERKRAHALEKAAAEKARREQERQAQEQKTRRERQEKDERARLALQEKEERARQSRETLAREAAQEPQHRTESEVDDKVEPRPVSIKFLGIAAAVVALVTVGAWLARSPAPTTVVQPSGEAARDLTSLENPSPATIAGGPAAPASPPATETRGNVQPAGSPATATQPVGSPATATRGAGPPVTATRGTAPVARPPTTTTRGTAPAATQPAVSTRGAPPLASAPLERVTEAAVPPAGPPPAEAPPPVVLPPTTVTTGTTPAVAPSLAADRPAIQQLLDRYVTAYSRMDEQGLKAIDPSFRGIARRELIRSVTLTLEQPMIDVSPDGQSAKLRATGEFRYVWNRSGLPPTSRAQWTWNLRKVGTTWTVVP